MTLLRFLLVPLILMVSPAAAHSEPIVVVLDLHDTIQLASLRYVDRGLREAAELRAELVVIEVDTPGGLLESLRSMTTAILGSSVPVVVYVTPSGARAASAGFFLLLAADVAAMAPGTNTGAAHPVMIGSQRNDDSGADNPSLDKAANDAAAFARSLAKGRERSVEAAEAAIFDSASYTAEEAREKRLVDVVTSSREQLLTALDGRIVKRFDGRTQQLQLDGARVEPIERTFAERVLTVIAAPQVAYLLMMIGVVCLMIELTSPGLIVPGIAGGLSLLLGLYGLSVLPVNLIGALLLAAGLALLVAEVFITSFGALAVAGIASFIVGSLMLVDAPVPELQIGPGVVVPVAVVLALIVTFLAIRAARSRHLRPQTGTEAMIGEQGKVAVAIEPSRDGKVFVHGAYWAATSAEAIPAGTKVRINAIDGLRLRVAPS